MKLPKSVTEGYEPGSFGFHEILDRISIIAEAFEMNVSEHPAAKHPDLQKRITKIEKELYKLYQIAGGLHV